MAELTLRQAVVLAAIERLGGARVEQLLGELPELREADVRHVVAQLEDLGLVTSWGNPLTHEWRVSAVRGPAPDES